MSALSAIAFPFIHMGELSSKVPIQSFGLIVAIGVLIGAALLRRYAEWHGVDDEIIRGLLGWVTVSGFIGAHEFDMIFYNWDKIGDHTVVHPPSWWPLGEGIYPSNWPLPLKLWEGISSYGGFLGGAIGWIIYVWWKRKDFRLFADITIVGLLPAFSIGRIGCTVVSDHVGAAVDPTKWYAFLAMDYPRKLNMGNLAEHYPNLTGETIKAWNLGLIELLYLIPVNAIILWLAFRPKPRPNAGYLTVLTGLMYAPVRFLMDYLRPEDSDPRHLGFTFAQWASILAFAVAGYALMKIMKDGTPAVPVAPTSGDAQRRLKMILKEELEAEEEREEEERAAKKAAKSLPKAEVKSEAKEKKSAEERAAEKEEEALAKEALAAGKTEDAEAAVAAVGKEEDKPADEEDDEDEEEKPEDKPTGTTPVGAARPGGLVRPAGARPGGGGGKKKNKKKKR
jgi:phosphatidylglycerol---prolipoprotein diacylglyceryl transferase